MEPGMNAHVELRLTAERIRALSEGGFVDRNEIQSLNPFLQNAIQTLATPRERRVGSFSDVLAVLKQKIYEIEVRVAGLRSVAAQAGSASTAGDKGKMAVSQDEVPAEPQWRFGEAAGYPLPADFAAKHAEPQTEVLLTASNQIFAFEKIKELDAIFRTKVPGTDEFDQKRYQIVKNALTEARRQCAAGEYFSEKDLEVLKDLRRNAGLCRDGALPTTWPKQQPQQEGGAEGGSREATVQVRDEEENWAEMNVEDLAGLHPLAGVIADTQQRKEGPEDHA